MTTALDKSGKLRTKPDVAVLICSSLRDHSKPDAVWIARCYLPNVGDMDDGELGDWLASKGLIDK